MVFRPQPRPFTCSACPLHPCRDKRVVRDPASEKDIWWGEGSPNYEMDDK